MTASHGHFRRRSHPFADGTDSRAFHSNADGCWQRRLGLGISSISYARHRFPPDVIRHAVWLYLRFTLSYRHVEELLAERGLDVSYETIRRWVLKFGLQFARNLRR